MKLLNRTSRYYLIFSLLVFAIIGLALFFALRYTLNHSTDDSLEHTRPALAREFSHLERLEPTMYIMDEIIEIRRIPALTRAESYRDTSITVLEENGETEAEPYRKYTYDGMIRGEPYRISISLSTLENEDLIRTLILVVLGGLLLFLLAINVLNRYLSRRLWWPFYRTLEQVKQFSVQQNTAPAFAHSETTEFNDLNRSLETMTGQLLREYDSLHRFTENASHEIQTPLAIIRNHVDMLLRQPERTEVDYGHIQGISEAISRLSKLNKSLLLLTKIEHDQFPDAAHLDLKPLLLEKLVQLAPMLEDKRITVTHQLNNTSAYLPPTLADILLNNLLGNAIRHNLENGSLDVALTEKQLTITNSGPAHQLNDKVIFDRFRKAGGTAESLGLGLAIVKEICDRYGLGIRYEQGNGWHRMRVKL